MLHPAGDPERKRQWLWLQGNPQVKNGTSRVSEASHNQRSAAHRPGRRAPATHKHTCAHREPMMRHSKGTERVPGDASAPGDLPLRETFALTAAAYVHVCRFSQSTAPREIRSDAVPKTPTATQRQASRSVPSNSGLPLIQTRERTQRYIDACDLSTVRNNLQGQELSRHRGELHSSFIIGLVT